MASRKQNRPNRKPLFIQCPLFSIAIILLFLNVLPSTFASENLAVAGVVHDKSEAMIPGAMVTLRLATTGAILSTQTDDQGTFRFQLSEAGTYQVTVTATGFSTYKAEVTVTSAEPAANLDVSVSIEGNTQTVEVTADALAAETTSTQLGEALGTKKIESVPLNGRSFTDLMAVQPGIVPENTAQPGAVIMTGVASTPPSGDANPGNLSISGQREDSNGFRVNGSDVEEDVNMGTSIVPNLDAIDSFRVLTSNFDAEYGNSSGGQVLVTTKSGTAQLHGSAFEFLRNTALDARNYFSQDRAAYRQNQFGGHAGRRAVSQGRDAVWRLPGNAADGGHRYRRHCGAVDGGARRGLQPESADGQRERQRPGRHCCRQRLGQTVTAGEPYAQVFPDGTDSAAALVGAGEIICWPRFPSRMRALGLFATAAAGRDAAGRQRRTARRLDATARAR